MDSLIESWISRILSALTSRPDAVRHIREVKMVDTNPEHYAFLIQQMLINETYEVGEYCIMERTVDSGKVRQIYRLDYYPHRIIHHAIIQVLETIWTRTLINDTYCCIKSRGIHKAANKIKRILMDDSDNTTYCLKLDINIIPLMILKTCKED